MKDPERILVVRLSHLGDVVCALPLFHTLRAAFPRATVGWVVQPEFAGLLDGLPGLQRTFRFERRSGVRAWSRLRRELRAFAPDVAVDAQGNWKSAMATRLSGAALRLGLAPDEWRERSAARLMTLHAPPSGEEHVVPRGLALARFVVRTLNGLDPVDARIDPGLTRDELDAARAELRRLSPDAATPLTLLHLTRPDDPRAWPPARFAELARARRAAGHAVVLVSGPREEDVGLTLARELGERAATPALRHLVGQRDLRRLAALFAAAAEVDASLVCTDSGPMHLACAVGLRVRCLEGPQSARRTGPWSAAGPRDDAALRAREQPDCAPCLSRRCAHPEGPVCMTRIGVEDVLRALPASGGARG